MGARRTVYGKRPSSNDKKILALVPSRTPWELRRQTSSAGLCKTHFAITWLYDSHLQIGHDLPYFYLKMGPPNMHCYCLALELLRRAQAKQAGRRVASHLIKKRKKNNTLKRHDRTRAAEDKANLVLECSYALVHLHHVVPRVDPLFFVEPTICFR